MDGEPKMYKYRYLGLIEGEVKKRRARERDRDEYSVLSCNILIYDLIL
jgi:hypothetical protein